MLKLRKTVDHIAQVAAVVARYAGSPEMVEKIREAVKTHQKHERAEASAVAIGLVLEKIVVGGVRARDAISSTMAGDSRMPSVAQKWWVHRRNAFPMCRNGCDVAKN